jgi:hypothetical protein
VAVKLGIQAGKFGPGSETARNAQDNAALVAELQKSGTWTTGEDRTPRKVTPTHIAGHSYGR